MSNLKSYKENGSIYVSRFFIFLRKLKEKKKIMFENEQTKITNAIIAFCDKNEIPLGDVIKWTNIPFSGEWGISTSFFQTAANEAKQGKKVIVPKRAQEIAESVAEALGSQSGFARIEATRGYLNLYFSTEDYAQRVIDEVNQKKSDYGKGVSKNERTMVEFSQPNTHKAFHIGHLRSMILGAALSNIHEFAGYDVVRANYIGDTGLHVIKWLWNFEKYHKDALPPETDVIRWLGDLYAEANKRLEDNPDFEEEIKAVFTRWNDKDPVLMHLWEITKQWSIDGFDKIYEEMGIRFDKVYYQSGQEEEGKDIVGILIEKGIAEDERPDGPVIVQIDEKLGLEKEKYRVAVILRSDGTALYATWDMALALKKKAEFNLEHSFYIVDVRQSMHFKQVFKILEIAGFEEAKICEHIPYEIVNLPGNVTMKSREGTVVLLEDLMREAVSRAREIGAERNPDLTEEERDVAAKAVGLAAIKYPMLARDNAKIATFDWEAALDFNGQAAPYIQYAHVRCMSMLRRGEGFSKKTKPITYALEPAEIQLIELLSQFPQAVQSASAENKTLHITNLAYEVAKAFNVFYRQCPVLKAEQEIAEIRLRIVDSARQVLANSLNILTIEAPIKM